jgi:hypothetical protein
MNIITNKDENLMFLNDFKNSIVGFSTKIYLDVLCDVSQNIIRGADNFRPFYHFP